MPASKQEFKEAVENDAFAEYDLGEGFYLITDWEGDGAFYPYVVPPKNYVRDESDEELEEVLDELNEVITFHDIEWDRNNELFVPISAKLAIE